jgi:4-alpha-glucanotransferase
VGAIPLPSPARGYLCVRNAAQGHALAHIDYRPIQQFSRYLVISRLFDSDQSIGAPPNLSSFHGRNWSYPAWNWDTMRANEFSWLRHRISCAENYFHICLFDR